MTEDACPSERERGYIGIGMDKKGFETLFQCRSVVFADGKGMNSIEIEGLKVVEMRWYGIQSGVGSQANVDPSSVLEDSKFSHVRQGAEFTVRGVPPLGAGLLRQS